jgi:cystathionine gamma-synthase
MTHASMSPKARATAGISDSLLRLSVGIEDARDLVSDIESGLDRAVVSTAPSSRPNGGTGDPPVLQEVPA